MKLIIDIDEEELTEEEIAECIRIAEVNFSDVTILPKGHGDLIDRDKAYDVLDNAGLSLNCSGLLRYVSTVIPADKEKNNETDN